MILFPYSRRVGEICNPCKSMGWGKGFAGICYQTLVYDMTLIPRQRRPREVIPRCPNRGRRAGMRSAGLDRCDQGSA
jgi:hypothetical protein